MIMTDYYAGVGSRDTPEHILNIMHHIGAYLATQGWVLRSGAASGADAAASSGDGGAQAKTDEKVVDAEFEEVDKDKK